MLSVILIGLLQCNRSLASGIRRNSIFAIFVTPIMQTVASLIIFEWIQFSERAGWPVVVNITKHFSKQRTQSRAEWVCLVHQKAFFIKTTLLKSLQRRSSQHTDLALIKTSMDNSRWQTARLIEFLRACTLLGRPIVNCKQHYLGWRSSVRGWRFSWKMWFHYSGRSNPMEEITFLGVCFSLI